MVCLRDYTNRPCRKYLGSFSEPHRSVGAHSFQENLLFFFSPTQVAAGEAPNERVFRLGGMVLKDSIEREPGSLTLSFVVTDYAHSMPVHYTGVLPDLFGEDQGVVARGKLDDQGGFVAEEILAKHDENYMPPEVADALARAEEAASQ